MNNSKEITLQVAIVGSGPSGFFVAEALINSGVSVEISILDRLPCPYGLVRYGVAPDHQKLKSVTQTLDAIAQNPLVTFIGNVNVGTDLTLKELKSIYHIVVLTIGMPKGASLGLDGEDLKGIHTSSDFIGWYNGHPDYQDKVFDLSQETAVIIGHGNVAIDICRILSKSIDELSKSDITEKALVILNESNINKVRLVGRRGPVQAKFATKELHELGKLDNCHVTVDPKYLDLGLPCHLELNDSSNQLARKNYTIYQAYSNNFSIENEALKKYISIDFMLNPKGFMGIEKLESALFEKTSFVGPAFTQSCFNTGEFLEIPCGLAITSVGFKGVNFKGLNINPGNGTLTNINSRLINDDGEIIRGYYTAGWVKRGPQGVIGTNRECAQDTVNHILKDVSDLIKKSAPGKLALINCLIEKDIHFVTFEDWQIIDAAEVARGQKLGKPREKFTTVKEMLACI